MSKQCYGLFPILLCTFGYTVATVINVSITYSRQTFSLCILENRSIMYWAGAMVFPICKVIIHTCIHVCKVRKYIPSMLKQIGIRLFILLTSSTVFISLDIHVVNYGANSNCTFISNIYNGTTTNYILITLSEVLAGFGSFIVLFVSLHFTVAQSPGTMRGLMVGIWYGSILS